MSRRERTAKPSRLALVRRVFVRMLAIAAAGGAVAGGYVQLTRAQSLAIREIVVEGTNPERADEIRALLNLKAGDNLLFADLQQTRARVESHPWVARCAIKRELPDVLRIVVEERSPRLILALDRLYYVDADAFAFKALSPGDAYDLPVLTGLEREDLLHRPAAARAAIQGALALIDALNEGDTPLPSDQVSEITWDEDEGYSVITVNGTLTVRFGKAEFPAKLARLREVRDRSRRSGDGDAGKTIDLTYASRVIVAR